MNLIHLTSLDQKFLPTRNGIWINPAQIISLERNPAGKVQDGGMEISYPEHTTLFGNGVRFTIMETPEEVLRKCHALPGIPDGAAVFDKSISNSPPTPTRKGKPS